MKYFKIIIIPILIVVTLLVSCERDDICPEDTPTTPRLIIDLYDASNTDNKKNAFDLIIFGLDNDNIVPGYNIVNTDQLILPLKTDVNSTKFKLTTGTFIDDNNTPDDTSDDFYNGENQDIITINYSRELVYVSRACGYKTIFKNVTLTIEDDGDNWLLSRQPLTDNQSVENETTAHFIISH